MEELSLDELQKCELDMLRIFDDYAKKHDLEYYMSGGTLLGAVRHKGFIPWDDDIDLMMPRPDYEYLIRHFKSDRYKISCCETDKDYCSIQARIWDKKTLLKWDRSRAKEKEIGVFIDIFPIDGYPSSRFRTTFFLLFVKLIRSLNSSTVKEGYGDQEKFILLKKIMNKFIRKDGNYYARKLNKFAKRYPYNESEYVGVVGTIAHMYREKNPKKIFAKTIMMQFEELSLPAPIGYKKYLRHLYGDYMKLPPVEQRVSEHDFKIYRL